MHSDEATAAGQRRFATTRWSVVLAAGADPSEQADRALAELCANYWYPLYAYVRRRGYEAEDARDLTQAFFAKLLEKKSLAAADPARGRFRSFLLTSMKNFLASEWRRQATLKRGGDEEVLSIDYEGAEHRYRVEPAHAFTPEAIYERRWALALLERAVDDVQKRYAGRGYYLVMEFVDGVTLRQAMAGGGFAIGGLAFGVAAIGGIPRAALDLSAETMQWLSLAAWGLVTAVVTAAVVCLVVWFRDVERNARE